MSNFKIGDRVVEKSSISIDKEIIVDIIIAKVPDGGRWGGNWIVERQASGFCAGWLCSITDQELYHESHARQILNTLQSQKNDLQNDFEQLRQQCNDKLLQAKELVMQVFDTAKQHQVDLRKYDWQQLIDLSEVVNSAWASSSECY